MNPITFSQYQKAALILKSDSVTKAKLGKNTEIVCCPPPSTAKVYFAKPVVYITEELAKLDGEAGVVNRANVLAMANRLLQAGNGEFNLPDAAFGAPRETKDTTDASAVICASGKPVTPTSRPSKAELQARSAAIKAAKEAEEAKAKDAKLKAKAAAKAAKAAAKAEAKAAKAQAKAAKLAAKAEAKAQGKPARRRSKKVETQATPTARSRRTSRRKSQAEPTVEQPSHAEPATPTVAKPAKPMVGEELIAPAAGRLPYLFGVSLVSLLMSADQIAELHDHSPGSGDRQKKIAELIREYQALTVIPAHAQTSSNTSQSHA